MGRDDEVLYTNEGTIRGWLENAGFDWENGRILYQKVKDDNWGKTPGWSSPTGAGFISHDAPILDEVFSTGYGGPTTPRFIATDEEKLYFPAQYDGATWLEVIWKDIEKYLDFANYESPYPGGG